MKSISIIMPALNEEEGIEKTICSIPVGKLIKNGFNTEILVVDGSSTDNTVKIALGLGARVINSKRGYGKQYKAGFKVATGDIIVTGDSDGSYPFEEILTYLKLFEVENLEFMTVNRFSRMEDDAMNLSNKFGNLFLTLL